MVKIISLHNSLTLSTSTLASARCYVIELLGNGASFIAHEMQCNAEQCTAIYYRAFEIIYVPNAETLKLMLIWSYVHVRGKNQVYNFLF